MRDDPQRNLNWLAQELLEAERPPVPMGISDDTAELLAQVDDLLNEEPEPPFFVQKQKKQNKPTRGERMERSHISRQMDSSAAVFTKTKRQLRQEKRKQKRDSVNRNITGLVVLALLEIMGILCVLGWWLR